MLSLRPLAVAAVLCIVTAACGTVADPSPTGTVTAAPPASPSPSTAVARPCASAPSPADASGGPGPEAWWTDRVFYEVFVRSFADSDGDGIGDLRGLVDRLDQLNDGDPTTTDDLGVTALWLMPVAESPSYHGYDVTDYRRVETDYGTSDDFRALVAAAGARGIEIVVDLVMNHTSVEHPWFVDARTRGSEHESWYRWAEAHPGFGGPGGRTVWHPDGDRWYYGYFWEGMPDLDLTQPAVTAELDSIARFWLEDMGVAGFRIDAARHLIEDGSTLENTPATVEWLTGFRTRTHEVDPGALVLGEVWDATSNAARYVRAGAIDLAFDFALAAQWLAAVRSGDAESLRIIQGEVTDAYPPGGYASFLTNHDQDRVMDVVGGDEAAARQAATLLLTAPGIPFVYYGEEIGLRGRKPDERIRTPMPWTAEPPGYGFTTGMPWQTMADGVDLTNVATQVGDPESLRAHYRGLIALRATHPALRPGGSISSIASSEPTVYAVLRHDAASGDSVAVISNLADEPVANVVLTSRSGPLCGAPSIIPLLGSAPTDLAPPAITADGGIDAWGIGPLEAHEDLVVALRP